jgi:hypothetical protein
VARMIPAIVDPGTRSPGEREIFQRLRDEPSTEGWTVLHSLLLADHPTRVSGEADFIVIVPGRGVVVLEVKACRSLRVEDGVWHYGQQEKPDPRGPFRQASEAMHAIRSYLHRERPDLDGIVYWSAVAFPYVPFDMRSEEWHRWQVIDGVEFRSAPLSHSIQRVLSSAREHLSATPSARWFHRSNAGPTTAQTDAIASTLRPSVEVIETPRLRRRREHDELLAFTAEQYEALDSMSANPRVVFEGPAGTGKTLLALEAARRAGLQGLKVLLVCYNRSLGTWLRAESERFAGEVWTGSLSAYMLEVTGSDVPGERDSRHFWESRLPNDALYAILERSKGDLDLVIVDEAQDLMKDAFLDVIDVSLKGGLAAGSWRFFGDFERQALYGSDVTLDGFIDRRAPGTPVHSLRVNCRNTPRIAALTYLLGGLSPDYRRIRRPDDGIEPELAFYSSAAEAPERLTELLESLYRDGFSGRDIVVLSTKSRDSVAARVDHTPWKDRLRPLEDAEEGHAPYASIRAFKGLEAPIVVLTDLADITTDEGQALLYVAVTRPLNRLFLLLPEEMREQILRALANGEAP